MAEMRYAGERAFDPAVDGMDIKTAVVLGILTGFCFGIFAAVIWALAH
jgi:hypothetical protein